MPGNRAPYKSKASSLTVGAEPQQNAVVETTRVPGMVGDAVTLPDPEVDYLEDRVIGYGRELFDKRPGQRSFESGSITVRPQDGWPFAYLFGAEEVNTGTGIGGGSADTTTHVFRPLENDLPPTFTLAAGYRAPRSSNAGNFTRVFGGCAVSSGEISMDNENQLEVDLDVYAMSVDTNNSFKGGIDVPERDKWIFSDTSSNLSMFGQSFARVQDFSVSMDNGLESKYYLESDQSPFPYELLYNIIEYTLDTTISIDDMSLYNQLVNNTEDKFQASIQFQRPNGDSLGIAAYGCQIESAPHGIPEDDQTVDVDVSIVPERLEVRVEDSYNSAAYLSA